MIKVAIIGASGYTGAESIEIILRHNQAKLVYLSALPEECGAVDEVFPRFKGRCNLQIEPLDIDKLSGSTDVALCCLPHKVSMGFVPKLLDAGLKVVDFSADYRIKSTEVYEKFYQVKHTDIVNLKRAAYGLPELFRERIKGADLIANPGCYPTGALLAVAPLLTEGYCRVFIVNRKKKLRPNNLQSFTKVSMTMSHSCRFAKTALQLKMSPGQTTAIFLLAA